MDNQMMLVHCGWRTVLAGILLLTSGIAPAAEKVTYYHLDALGSPVAATDFLGEVVWRETYQPYGERVQNAPAAADNARWYTGHAQDPDTGLVYAGARYYDPVIGRFLAVDPVSFTEKNVHSFNRYAYGNNNPYRYVDPDGNESYLVSRPLSFTQKGNHNFIVTNAKSLGDPNATVHSYGDVGDDTMGPVDKNTKGFSAGTQQTDTKSWQGLSGEGSSTTYRKINAPDPTVDTLASEVDKGLEYSLIPELQGGVNSNTAAGAIAKKADGGSPSVNNGISQPGSAVTHRITFGNKEPLNK